MDVHVLRLVIKSLTFLKSTQCGVWLVGKTKSIRNDQKHYVRIIQKRRRYYFLLQIKLNTDSKSFEINTIKFCINLPSCEHFPSSSHLKLIIPLYKYPTPLAVAKSY